MSKIMPSRRTHRTINEIGRLTLFFSFSGPVACVCCLINACWVAGRFVWWTRGWEIAYFAGIGSTAERTGRDIKECRGSFPYFLGFQGAKRLNYGYGCVSVCVWFIYIYKLDTCSQKNHFHSLRANPQENHRSLVRYLNIDTLRILITKKEIGGPEKK